MAPPSVDRHSRLVNDSPFVPGSRSVVVTLDPAGRHRGWRAGEPPGGQTRRYCESSGSPPSWNANWPGGARFRKAAAVFLFLGRERRSGWHAHRSRQASTLAQPFLTAPNDGARANNGRQRHCFGASFVPRCLAPRRRRTYYGASHGKDSGRGRRHCRATRRRTYRSRQCRTGSRPHHQINVLMLQPSRRAMDSSSGTSRA